MNLNLLILIQFNIKAVSFDITLIKLNTQMIKIHTKLRIYYRKKPGLKLKSETCENCIGEMVTPSASASKK